ncbi:MAG: acyl-CoA dehydrogenase family protein [Armatimonadetes bacterium]|nr:acyl-CoA dehydrogenase family protein [Armatimonadota bacterium]
MDFDLPQENVEIYEEVQRFCDEELRPRAREVAEKGEFPWENWKAMGEMGLWGIPIPEEYGGAGMSWLDWAIIGEMISKACTSTGAIFAAHYLAQYPLLAFGTEKQKEKYLAPLASGEKVGSFILTEPGAGSDAGSVKTKAEKDGDVYRLNGTKVFCSNGGEAGVFVVIANLQPERGARGLTAFIVERDTPGFRLGKEDTKMAFRALSNPELIFEDAQVPAENLLYRERGGFRVAMETLSVGRIGMAVGAVGLAQAALEAAARYAQEREQFGQPIAEFEAIQFMLADMATQVEAARLLAHKAAWLKDQGREYDKIAAMAKVYASEVASMVASKAVQIHGGYGYTVEYDVERYYREAKLFEIVEGTSEIQRLVIANRVLKELRKE